MSDHGPRRFGLWRCANGPSRDPAAEEAIRKAVRQELDKLMLGRDSLGDRAYLDALRDVAAGPDRRLGRLGRA